MHRQVAGARGELLLELREQQHRPHALRADREDRDDAEDPARARERVRQRERARGADIVSLAHGCIKHAVIGFIYSLL